MSRYYTIRAIVKKELTQFVRYPTWIIQMLIWPLIFPLAYVLPGLSMAGPDGGGFEQFMDIAGTDSFMGFVVIGTMVWMWSNMTMWNFGTLIREEQMRGTLESNWLCPISHVDLLIGGAIVSILMNLFTVVVSIVEYRLVYGVHFTGNIFSWIVCFIVLIPGVYGFGSIFASLVLWFKETGAAVQLIRGFITIFCGISFPIMVLPNSLRIISDILPFTYGINLSRNVMLNGISIFSIQALKDMIPALVIGIILLIAGRLCFLKVEKKVKNEGSLERF
ncbi:MAG: ABC transporter permease [Clostridium sp.]|uniref:ABC transporter permease n=1 Tax=Clostridium sp. TaxID=1506 RepID=UPI002A872257|nr:ABC transporter permease [Clostridium sp.]MDY5097547.1 ABC transporter permease [Clostridium sp.]